eukprot:763912-Hanusia_phi.AAC.2
MLLTGSGLKDNILLFSSPPLLLASSPLRLASLFAPPTGPADQKNYFIFYNLFSDFSSCAC